MFPHDAGSLTAHFFTTFADYRGRRGTYSSATLAWAISKSVGDSLIPWPTPVLGSGCSAFADPSAIERLARLVAHIPRAVTDAQSPIGDDSFTTREDLTIGYLRALCTDRIDSSFGDHLDNVTRASTVTVPEPACGYTLEVLASWAYVAALLTLVTDTVLTDSGPRTWATEGGEISFGGTVNPWLTDGLKPTVMEALSALHKDNAGVLQEPDRDILTGLVTSVAGNTVELNTVASIQEGLWAALLAEVHPDSYVGWSELQLLSSVQNRAFPHLASDGRPQAPLEEGRTISDFVSTTSERSWRRRKRRKTLSDELGKVHRFYDNAAALIDRQANQRVAVRRRTGGGRESLDLILPSVDQPPVASAIVTSFDLELVMSLFTLRSESGAPFLMAVPVHVIRDDRDDRDDGIIWLGAIVSPRRRSSTSLEETLRAASSWFVLSGLSHYEVTSLRQLAVDGLSPDAPPGGWCLGDLPVVVHLNGCPLISLPDPRDVAVAGGSALGFSSLDDCEFRHAVLRTDADALAQMALELFEIGDRDSAFRSRLGLPRPITGTPGHVSDFARYWMVLGVPVSWSRVRFRVIAQLAAGTPGRWPKGANGRKATGLVVDPTLTQDDSTVFRTLGFDCVRDSHVALGDLSKLSFGSSATQSRNRARRPG